MDAKIKEDTKKVAMDMLRQHRGLDSVFIVPDEGHPTIELINKFGKDDYERVLTIGAYCRYKKYNNIIFVIDGHNRKLKEKEFEFAINNMETENPSLYPESMLQRCLLFYFIEFEKKICEGVSIDYKFNDEFEIEFTGEKNLSEEEVNTNITPYVLKGYYEVVDELQKKGEIKCQ